jgi:hypothetical protein
MRFRAMTSLTSEPIAIIASTYQGPSEITSWIDDDAAGR